jgi:hypothetical protein
MILILKGDAAKLLWQLSAPERNFEINIKEWRASGEKIQVNFEPTLKPTCLNNHLFDTDRCQKKWFVLIGKQTSVNAFLPFPSCASVLQLALPFAQLLWSVADCNWFLYLHP